MRTCSDNPVLNCTENNTARLSCPAQRPSHKPLFSALTKHKRKRASLARQKHSTKAQIKMFETIGVLAIFFALLVGGGAFYFKMQESALQKELAKARQLRLLQSSLKATFLPELDCTFVTVQRENCFDKLKLEAFENLSQKNKQHYFGLFGTSRITVSEVYPKPGFVKVLYDNPLEEYESKLVAQNPVLLYDPVTNTYGFGVLEVESYAE